jgi:hypothetical protein
MAEGLNDWGRRSMPLFHYTLTFASQLRENTENHMQFRRLMLDTFEFKKRMVD